MATVNRLVNQRTWMTREDLLQADKAIDDQLHADVQDQFSDVEMDVILKVTKVLERKLEQLFAERLHEHMAAFTKDMGQAYETKSFALEEDYQKKEAWLQKTIDDKASFLQAAYDQGIEQISKLVKDLQLITPQVHFTAPAPVVTNEIYVPEMIVKNEINVSPPRLKDKTFEYLPDGRPFKIIEHEKVEGTF